jgi:hypothetical protein
LNRFGNMLGADVLGIGQIGDRAGHFAPRSAKADAINSPISLVSSFSLR